MDAVDMVRVVEYHGRYPWGDVRTRKVERVIPAGVVCFDGVTCFSWVIASHLAYEGR